jgi:hypothetical protein
MPNHLAGGIPQFNHITHLKLNEFTLSPIHSFLDQHPDINSMLCLFSGEQAVRFYEEVLESVKTHPINLFVSPMMLEPALSTVWENCLFQFLLKAMFLGIPISTMLPTVPSKGNRGINY